MASGLPLERHPVHGFVLRTPVLARGLGVSANTVRVIRREHSELLEGQHWVRAEQRNGGQPTHLSPLDPGRKPRRFRPDPQRTLEAVSSGARGVCPDG